MKKRFLAMMLSLSAVLTACSAPGAGSGSDGKESLFYKVTNIMPDTTMVTVDGKEASARMYLYWLNYTMDYFASQMTGYVDESGNILWDEVVEEDVTVKDAILNETLNTVKMYLTIEKWAEEYDIKLSEDEEAAITETNESMKTQLGGQEAYDAYMWDMGLDEETNLRFTRIFYYYAAMEKGCADPESPFYITDEELASFEGVTEDTIVADHILMMLGEDEETNAKTLETMESVHAMLDEAKANGEDVELLFDYAANQMSQDPGRAYYPTGYLLTPDANYVQAFKDAAFSLEEGEYSGVVESEYGYHILMRKSLRTYFAQEHLNAKVTEALDNAEVTYTDTYNEFIETLPEYRTALTTYLSENSAFDKVMEEQEAGENDETSAGDGETTSNEGETGNNSTGETGNSDVSEETT